MQPSACSAQSEMIYYILITTTPKTERRAKKAPVFLEGNILPLARQFLGVRTDAAAAKKKFSFCFQPFSPLLHVALL